MSPLTVKASPNPGFYDVFLDGKRIGGISGTDSSGVLVGARIIEDEKRYGDFKSYLKEHSFPEFIALVREIQKTQEIGPRRNVEG